MPDPGAIMDRQDRDALAKSFELTM